MQNLPEPGIYKITCIPTQKVYIGQSVNIKKRIAEHRRKLKINKHDNQYLQAAVDKYGIENFKFQTIENLEKDAELLFEREKYWIEFFQSTDRERGFNLREGGLHAGNSEETREKLSKALKGRMPTEANIKARIAGSSKPCSEEKKKKISESNKGRVNPDESFAKGWETRKANGNTEPWNKGKAHTEEQKAKQRETWRLKRESKNK